MAPILRSMGGPTSKTTTKEGEEANPHPIYDENYFASNILLAEQPIVGEPGIVVFGYHPYILIRAGHSLAVSYINAEKWSEKSEYGKALCSRMSTCNKYKMYRVDFPGEDEPIFTYYVEYVNTGSYRTDKDTFRGTFCRHLKLYEVALKYDVPGLAGMVLGVISDMLIESHPEHTTRACFWSLVVDQAYKSTKEGDPLRDIVSGFPVWYMKQGRGRDYNTHSGTVKHGLFLLKNLPSANRSYQSDFGLFKDNTELLEQKLKGYLGVVRQASSSLTQMWRDTIEDPLFENWVDHWKVVERAKRANNPLEVENDYYDSLDSLKMADDEDKVAFLVEETSEKKSSSKKKSKKKPKEAKKVVSKKRSLQMINRTRAQKASDGLKNTVLPRKQMNSEASASTQENSPASIQEDLINLDFSLDEINDDEVFISTIDINDAEKEKEKEVAQALIELASGQDRFGLDGTYDRLKNPVAPITKLPGIKELGLLQMHLSFPQANGTFNLSEIPGRKFNARVVGGHNIPVEAPSAIRISSGAFPAVHGNGMPDISYPGNISEAEENIRYEGLKSHAWQERIDRKHGWGSGVEWVNHLEAIAGDMIDSEVEDTDTINDDFHGLPIFLSTYGDRIGVWNNDEGAYEEYHQPTNPVVNGQFELKSALKHSIPWPACLEQSPRLVVGNDHCVRISGYPESTYEKKGYFGSEFQGMENYPYQTNSNYESNYSQGGLQYDPVVECKEIEDHSNGCQDENQYLRTDIHTQKLEISTSNYRYSTNLYQKYTSDEAPDSQELKQTSQNHQQRTCGQQPNAPYGPGNRVWELQNWGYSISYFGMASKPEGSGSYGEVLSYYSNINGYQGGAAGIGLQNSTGGYGKTKLPQGTGNQYLRPNGNDHGTFTGRYEETTRHQGSGSTGWGAGSKYSENGVRPTEPLNVQADTLDSKIPVCDTRGISKWVNELLVGNQGNTKYHNLNHEEYENRFGVKKRELKEGEVEQCGMRHWWDHGASKRSSTKHKVIFGEGGRAKRACR